MYARTLKSKGRNLDLVLTCLRSRVISHHYTCGTSSARIISAFNQHIHRKLSCSPQSWPNQYQIKHYNTQNSFMSLRLYSSKGDGSNASEGKHIPVKDGVNVEKIIGAKEELLVARGFVNEHARLAEQEQQEWLSSEKFSINSKKEESPFLTRRQRFKNEFLRRVIPWDKINLSLDSFPYYLK
jgi:hypothetical protein